MKYIIILFSLSENRSKFVLSQVIGFIERRFLLRLFFCVVTLLFHVCIYVNSKTTQKQIFSLSKKKKKTTWKKKNFVKNKQLLTDRLKGITRTTFFPKEFQESFILQFHQFFFPLYIIFEILSNRKTTNQASIKTYLSFRAYIIYVTKEKRKMILTVWWNKME